MREDLARDFRNKLQLEIVFIASGGGDAVTARNVELQGQGKGMAGSKPCRS